MISDLSKKYNIIKPFNDANLFDEISTNSGFPKEIRAFFKQYVEGSERLPIGIMMD